MFLSPLYGGWVPQLRAVTAALGDVGTLRCNISVSSPAQQQRISGGVYCGCVVYTPCTKQAAAHLPVGLTRLLLISWKYNVILSERHEEKESFLMNPATYMRHCRAPLVYFTHRRARGNLLVCLWLTPCAHGMGRRKEQRART